MSSFAKTLPPIVAADSPLAEAMPESLEELFSRDPLELSDQDLDKMVESFRKARALWAKEEAEKASKPKSRGAKPTIAAPKSLNLADLGL